MLLFRLYEKVTKRDVFTFFLLLQKEPKSSRDFVLRPRFKILSGGLLAKPQALRLSRCFCVNL